MDNYNILLNEIKEYLKKDEVDKTNTCVEIISAYDLYHIVNNELEGLRNITINSKINKKIKDSFIKSFMTSKFHYTRLRASNDKTILVICERGYSNKLERYYNDEIVLVIKDRNINDIYINNLNDEDNKQIHKFIKKNYNLILETLSIREYYYDLLKQYMGFFNISDDLFTAKLFYTGDGEVNVDINIADNHKFQSEYSKKWYKRESISDFVEKTKMKF